MARIADVMSLRVLTVTPDETVQLAIARMLEENVGSVAVCEGNHLVGIFTERDVLRLAGENTELQELRVGDVMTRRVLTVSPDDEILAAGALMAERRIRHLPVVQDGMVMGIVGLRDVTRSLLELVWRDHDGAARETARQLLKRA
jgi:CBS domain-containing protein